FIQNGLKTGIENIIHLTEHLHLSEGTGLTNRQETSGTFPTLKRVSADWYEGNTANICIGQGQMAVTPLQMAVMISAIANGGKVLWPRLVDRIEPVDASVAVSPIVFETARVRDELGVRPENLRIVREAMLEETQPGGTGERARVPGLD